MSNDELVKVIEEKTIRLVESRQYASQLERILSERSKIIEKLEKEIEDAKRYSKLSDYLKISKLEDEIKKANDEIEWMNNTYKPDDDFRIKLIKDYEAKIESLEFLLSSSSSKHSSLIDRCAELSKINDTFRKFLEEKRDELMSLDFLDSYDQDC